MPWTSPPEGRGKTHGGSLLTPPIRARQVTASLIETRLRVLLAACFVALSVICILRTPSVSFDASFGLLTWQSMLKGSDFNYLRMASPDNMATDHDTFWAAHCPGQFYLPGIISNTVGVPIGTGLVSLQLVGIALGIVGYYLLYVRMFRFPKTVALVACVVILFRRETLYQFIVYSGGGLLLFAGTPFFLMSSWACLKRRGFYLTLVPLIFLAGAFLKLSFVLVAFSLILASVLSRLIDRAQSGWRRLTLQSTSDVFAFLVFYGLLYGLHTSRGWTAAHPDAGTSLSQVTFFLGYSLAAIASGMMSIFWSLARLGCPLNYLRSELYRIVSFLWAAVLTAVAAASLGIMCAVLSRGMRKREQTQQEYGAILVSLAVVHLLVLTSLFLGGSLIAEDRHFWPVSAVLLPGLLSIIMTMRFSHWRSVLLVIIALQIGYALSAFGIALRRSGYPGKSRSWAISYPAVPQELIDTIERLDADLSGGRNV